MLKLKILKVGAQTAASFPIPSQHPTTLALPTAVQTVGLPDSPGDCSVTPEHMVGTARRIQWTSSGTGPAAQGVLEPMARPLPGIRPN